MARPPMNTKEVVANATTLVGTETGMKEEGGGVAAAAVDMTESSSGRSRSRVRWELIREETLKMKKKSRCNCLLLWEKDRNVRVFPKTNP